MGLLIALSANDYNKEQHTRIQIKLNLKNLFSGDKQRDSLLKQIEETNTFRTISLL